MLDFRIPKKNLSLNTLTKKGNHSQAASDKNKYTIQIEEKGNSYSKC
jgi:hypothetical protein